MSSNLFLQRYNHGDDIVAHAGTIEADQDTEKMWSQPYQPTYTDNDPTHGLSRKHISGVSEPPIAPRGPSLTNLYHQQHGGGQAYSNQAPGSGGSGGGGGMADSGRQVDAHWQYGQGAGCRGDVQGSQGYGWQQLPEHGAYWHDYGQSLYSASSASEWYYPQRRDSYGYGHQERYAQPRYDPRLYPPYEQYTGYHQQYDQRPLMRQYHTAQVHPPFVDGSAPAATPQDARPSASVKRQPPPQSIWPEPLRTTRKFEQDFFKPSFVPQMAQVSSPPPPPLTPPGANQTRSNDRESLEWMQSARQARDSQAKLAVRVKKQPPQQSPMASAMKTRSQTAESRRKVRTTATPQVSRPDIPEDTRIHTSQPFSRSFPSNIYSPNFAQASPCSQLSPLLNLLGRPKPTWTYMKQAEEPPGRLANGKTRPLLVVLDLNGTLLHRAARGGSIFTTRLRVPEFLHYLLANHKVLIWSSAQPANVEAMCKKLFTPEQRAKLVGIWARDKMRLSPQQYAQKVQCYKQLSWVWRDDDIAASCVHTDEWAQDNTVLIDDSVEKAATEPFNLIKMEAFEGTEEQLGKDVLGQVVEYLEVLKGARDVSACIRAAPYYFRPEKEAVFD
ncbi:hypothetical protein LTR91_016129 [Friedmanniomyces endolithicus]|uniref:FCP1 homology domain-containing protein n=1 Tax=Friedmanniomyces endolithicus TaxID=329885 RepID=A0AAN6QL43_9PEZI|nr:hypothetical protein LTR57_016544 [Friedmanniomyces endolithicus]KAK0969870.1 hypothetical protein LTR91_016129 [Friedmanniomyces endolithicus]KAK0976003.1 hypothetical protein LTS01_013637 [Friedmanniomyces endolithicus]KAK1025000.1 hypothetical protein LTS16_023571 [Friedmanniomyces endolithicus]